MLKSSVTDVRQPVWDLMMKNIYNIDEDDVWWSASDIGWIVGHSYIVYMNV